MAFRVHVGKMNGQSVHLTGLWEQGFCVCCLRVVGLISLFGLLLGLLGERTIVSIKSRQSKWRRGEEGVERRERTGEAGRGSGREALMEKESSRN